MYFFLLFHFFLSLDTMVNLIVCHIRRKGEMCLLVCLREHRGCFIVKVRQRILYILKYVYIDIFLFELEYF